MKTPISESKPLTRREFTACITGTAFLMGASKTRAQLAPAIKARVIIIGAGITGLCAAYELQERGCSVTILEAEASHIGGRVRTARFENGLYGELGAMRIPASHKLTHHYIQAFGLKTRPFVEYNPQGYYLVGARRHRNRDIGHLDSRYTSGMDGRAGGVWSQKFTEIVGGTDLLAKAFASRLKSKPLMGRRVTGVTQSSARGPNPISVTFVTSGSVAEEKTLQADFVICTVPLPVLHKIAFNPPLPAAKLSAIKCTPYAGAHKVLAVTRTRFWELEDGIYGGATYTDQPSGMTYYPSDNATAHDPDVSKRSAVLLASYTLGSHADKFAKMSSADSGAVALNAAASVHHQLAVSGQVKQTLSWSWGNHPNSKGGFAMPGKREDLRSELQAPHGRVLFAGEHTSAHRTWILGGLESALRCVKEIAERTS